MPETYLAEKLAEWWIGGPLPQPPTFQMEQGNILEDHAIGWCNLEFKQEISRPGLCLTDDERIGASPDGIIGGNIGLEIKCPSLQKHVAYLLNGVLPPDYIAQIQGGLFVTGLPEWRFVSYRRMMPNLVLTVMPDAKYQSALADALARFLAKLEAGKKRLEELNGGPPWWITNPPMSEPPASQHQQAQEQDEVGVTP